MTTSSPSAHPDWTEIDTSTPQMNEPTTSSGPLDDLIAQAMKDRRLNTRNDFRRSAQLSCSEFARLSTPAQPSADILHRLAVALDVPLSVLTQRDVQLPELPVTLPSTPPLNLDPQAYPPQSLMRLITDCMERNHWTSLRDFSRQAGLNQMTLDTLLHLRATTGLRAVPNWATAIRLALILDVSPQDILRIFQAEQTNLKTQAIPLILAHDTTEFPHELLVHRHFVQGRPLVAYHIQDTGMTGGGQAVGWGDVVLVHPQHGMHPGDMVLAHLKNSTALCRTLQLGGGLASTRANRFGDVSCIFPDEIDQLIGPVVGVVHSLF